jgi:hypothetical protein
MNEGGDTSPQGLSRPGVEKVTQAKMIFANALAHEAGNCGRSKKEKGACAFSRIPVGRLSRANGPDA